MEAGSAGAGAVETLHETQQAGSTKPMAADIAHEDVTGSLVETFRDSQPVSFQMGSVGSMDIFVGGRDTFWVSMPCGIPVRLDVGAEEAGWKLMGEQEPRKQIFVGNEQTHDCGEMDINRAGDAYIGIGAKTGCPVCPGQSMGRTIMEALHLIAHDFGVKRLELHDGGFLACKKSTQSGTSLAVFRSLTKGATWYESFGFKFDATFFTSTQLMPHIHADTLHRDELATIGKLPVPSTWATARLAPFIKKSNSKTIGALLGWIWSNHCDVYEEIVAPLRAPGSNVSLVYVGTGRMDDHPTYLWGFVQMGMRKVLK